MSQGRWLHRARIRLERGLQTLGKKKSVMIALDLNSEVFPMLLVTSLLLLLSEAIWKGSVSFHLDVSYLIIASIISGAMVILTSKGELPQLRSPMIWHYVFVILTGLAGGVIIWYATRDIGPVSYLVSGLGGAVITILSILLLVEQATSEHED